MLTIIKNYLKEKYNKPGNVYLGLIHRLDRPVGGVMVFAKTSKAAARVSEQVREKVFQKTFKTFLAKYHKTPFKFHKKKTMFIVFLFIYSYTFHIIYISTINIIP